MAESFNPWLHASKIQRHLQSYARGLRVFGQRLLADVFAVDARPCGERNPSDQSSGPPHPNLHPRMDLVRDNK